MYTSSAAANLQAWAGLRISIRHYRKLKKSIWAAQQICERTDFEQRRESSRAFQRKGDSCSMFDMPQYPQFRFSCSSPAGAVSRQTFPVQKKT
jgi:hypothetical protein